MAVPWDVVLACFLLLSSALKITFMALGSLQMVSSPLHSYKICALLEIILFFLAFVYILLHCLFTFHTIGQGNGQSHRSHLRSTSQRDGDAAILKG